MDEAAVTGVAVLPNQTDYWEVAGAADFSDDGRADILWRGDQGEVCVWTMDGTEVAGAADFGGDGRADILWRGQSGEAYIWKIDGAAVTGVDVLPNPTNYWEV